MGFLIPRGFEAYARVLHPARPRDSDEPVSWATVAHKCGTTLHPQAQWLRLAGHRDLDPRGEGPDPVRWEGQDPSLGLMDRPPFEALVEVLGRHTSTPGRSIVAFWVGYGVWPHAWRDLPTSAGPGRESHLFERSLSDVPTLCAEAPAVRWALGESEGVFWVGGEETTTAPSADDLLAWFAKDAWQSPSAWWPADRAWATSNDTDLDSTLIGGPRALVDELLADDRLEVLPWPVDGSLWSGDDAVNQ